MSCPLVSVVVPVYNVAKYLPRCLDSISNQTLREIEIIAVDDGSTDDSGRILDDWAKREPRMRVVRQANAGAGVARNSGLDLATGEYLFFFDPDDSADRRMLAGMYARARAKSADIVIAGKATVDAETGKIVSKYGFHRDIWRFHQPFSGREIADHVFTLAKSVPWDKLFRREFVSRNGLRFQDTRRSNDVFFVDMALALAERIALVPRAYYRYSLDRKGSLQSNKDKSPLVFLDAYDALERGLRERGVFEVFSRCFSRVFFRTAVFNLRHLKESANVAACYREVRRRLIDLRTDCDLAADELLSGRLVGLYEIILENETESAFEAQRPVRIRMDDEEDLQRRTSLRRLIRRWLPVPVREMIKVFRVRALNACRRRAPETDPVTSARRRKAGRLVCDFVTLRTNSLRLEFSYYRRGSEPPSALPGDAGLEVCDGLSVHRVNLTPSFTCALRMVDGGRVLGRRFFCEIGIVPGRRHSVVWKCENENDAFNWGFVRAGTFSALHGGGRRSSMRGNGWIVCKTKGVLTVAPDGVRPRLIAWVRQLASDLIHSPVAGAKAFVLRFLAAVVRAFSRRPIWLISDRPDRADDNARALFEYACALPLSQRKAACVFAVSRRSPDFAELRRLGPCVPFGGLLYKLLFLSAEMVVSAYRTRAQRLPFSNAVAECLRKFLSGRYRFACVRHGISQNDMADDVGRWHLNARLLFSAVPAERASILSGGYGYTDREVKLCGMARYDLLYDDRKRLVVFMPTWRSYLTAGAGTNRLADRQAFADSAFCRGYRDVLGDESFVNACRERGFGVALMMHPNMRDALSEMALAPEVEILSSDVRYRDVFARADLVVTDYSSVAFDVAYLKKPVVYYQFDRDQFFGGQYRPGYFDTGRDGFGEVETDADALKRRVLAYLENGAQMKPEYRKRVDDFFAFTDRNNCQRVYEAICEAVDEDAEAAGSKHALHLY